MVTTSSLGKHAFSALLAVALLATPALSQVVYVDGSAAPGGTGTSWADAYDELQEALAATRSGEIWVAAGTYHPGLPGDRTATYQLKNNVTIYGGFDGTETSLAQRDVAANATILSADIDDDDTYGTGWNWWQFNWTGSSNNSYHIVTGTGTDPSAVLDGVTLLAGVGSDPALKGGGGLVVNGGSPTLRYVTFQYNAIGYGSAAYLIDCNSTFENCVIKDGYTCNCGGGGWTSGILATGTSDVMFVDCDFINHYYVSSMSQGRGAALNIDFGASGTVIGCRFIANQTGNFFAIGGGTARGAGLNAHGDIVVESCEFLDNFAHAGAGLTAWNNVTVTNSLFARNEAVPHEETKGLTYGDYGAGMLILSSAGDTIEISNSTFVDNNSEKGAGIAAYGSGTAVIRNTIIFDNYADPTPPGEDPIWILKQNLVGDYDLANSCVEYLLETEPGEDPPEPENFPGCFDESPQLMDIGGEDYRLATGSPCIDSGDNAEVPVGLTTDLAGDPRFIDDPATLDTGLGTAPIVDMGAFEFGGGGPWTDLGSALAGVGGPPSLVGSGTLLPGSPMALTLAAAAPFAPMTLIAGFSRIDASFKGGVLVPQPTLLLGGFVTDGAGGHVLPALWPASVPSGATFYLQEWIVDAAGPVGLSASNGLRAVTP